MHIEENRSCNSFTSSEFFKNQVEFVFLFKKLYQLQDVPAAKEGKIKSLRVGAGVNLVPEAWREKGN